MGLSIKGYVLEPPRVGGSNSAFTLTPNVYISNQSNFDAAYPSDESAPRTEYFAFVLNDFVPPGTGPGNTRSFVDAAFAWSKNEIIQRFDYDGKSQRFKTYPGSKLEVPGDLSVDSNTDRLKVTIPLTTDLSACPIRISIGSGSGTTMTVTLVLNDAAFSTPAVGTVQLSQETGNLNWNPADLTTYSGQEVRFQRQTFYTFKDSSGNLGSIDDVLLLNPIPGSGQFPLIRIGFAEYLTPIQRATEVGFSANPAAGTVEWALTTGRLKFNSTDVTNASGRDVYYDGSTYGFGLHIPITNAGTVNAPGTIALPPEASDTFFRIPGQVQFAQTQFVDTLTYPGKKGIVQIRRSDGQVKFSSDDQVLYGGSAVQAVTADIDIERGITLRMFRTPVNPDDADPSLKDVACFYESVGALLASPIIGAPEIFLPAIPVDSRPLTVTVSQGTGSFTGILPRMDVPTPPTGLGYILDYEKGNLVFAQRKVNQVLPAPAPYGGVQLPDTLVFDSNLVLEVETTPNSGVYTPLTIGEDALIDLPSGSVTLVSTDGELIVDGTGATLAGTTFTDPTKNFTTAGVQAGDYLIVLDGASKGVYRLTSAGTTTVVTDVAGTAGTNLTYEIRRGAEILADRFFFEVPPVDPNTSVERLTNLGVTTNSPRITIDPAKALDSRFRFGKTTFSTTTAVVAADANFTSPGSLAQGVVQVSQATGHLNFSQADVTAGDDVYWSKTLTLGIDYTLQPPLGFIELSERMLEKEEAFVIYKNANGDLVQERAAFLIRKEPVIHPTPTNVMTYNMESPREPAMVPSPRAFRGGRPQDSSQVLFNVPNSTLTFIGQPTATNALPSGPTVDPGESVYVDYYVYEAVGGENNFTVLEPPMQSVSITITEGEDNFEVPGDRTDIFVANTLLLIDDTESYLIGTSAYASGVTTVTLSSPQTFKSDFQNPSIKASSGPLRLTGSPANPSYFLTEMSGYDPVPKGSDKIKILGDVSRIYEEGTVVYFTDGTYLDFNLVAGSSFDVNSNKTEISLVDKGARQYSGVTFKRSVRPVLSTPSASATTSRSPELGQVYRVYRRVAGEVGTVLSSPADYTIDPSGVVKLTDPLERNEEAGIFYTGDLIVDAGRRFRSSYTFSVVPSDSNGLVNQTLKMDYTTYIPDTFFWRVETFTNFRGELVEAYEEEAKSSVPTGGPILENSSSPKLFKQGRESVFFQEGYLANEDLVARPTLKYYNDAINYLEDALQALDGRVVGDHDGRFLFDGNTDNPPRTTFETVTNQIDDRFKISPAPYVVTGPPFLVTSLGTYQEVYKASATSRFYPTKKSRFGVTVDPSGLETGDAIMDTGVRNLTSVSDVQRRHPWAVTTAYGLAGSTTLSVDDADGRDDLLRPAFTNGMKVAIDGQDGTSLVEDSSSLTVTAVTATSISLGALPVNIPIGSTVRLATNDTSYNKSYRLEVDIGYDLEKGLLTYKDPSSSLLAWAGLTQTPSPPGAGEVLDVSVTFNNQLTAPERFPALDGGSTDDDGNRQFPILTPAALSEGFDVGYVATEDSLINTTTGRIRSITTPSFEGTGSVDVTGMIITNGAGAWLAPVPQIYDLLEVFAGPGSPSSYYRITAVGANTVTLDTPLPVSSATGLSFSITVSAALESGTATVSPTNTLTDVTSTFDTAGVKPGHTVVITSGVYAGLRRQVVAVVSATVLTITPLPGTTTATYRVVNSVETYGGPNSLINTELIPALLGQQTIIGVEIAAIDSFFNSVFTDMAVGTNGQSSGTIFTSSGQTFLTNEVDTSHLLFIRVGALTGFYKIQQILSETSLEIEGSFPANISGVAYRIVKSIGLTRDPLNSVLEVVQTSTAYQATIPSFLSVVSNSVAVLSDSGAFAIRLRPSVLNNRSAIVSDRLVDLPNSVTGLEGELSAGDRLYDKRYVWIDARINLENGILVSKERAIARRIKAQADTVKQLTKLLSVRQT